MGIYYNHGVEYRVFLINGTVVLVVPMKESDSQLISSNYYKKREEEWMLPREAFVKPVEEDFDITLSETHQKRLENALETFKGQISSHGWFEVNLVTNTH